MNILLTGGTGLIGRALCRRLLAEGHSVSVWSRRPAEVPALCGAQVRGVSELSQLDGEHFDAVVNLAGAPVADRPWTAKRKAVLWASRVSLTERLVQWLGEQARKPQVMVSGSAVGWYGDGGSEPITEQSPANKEYTHTLCDAWEAAAKRVTAYGVRLCIMRTGLVVAAEGGFLARLKPPFKLGLGGPIGSGEQYMPWVHLDDVVALIVWLLQNPECRGAYNASAPHPVTNREFVKELGRALGRPAVLPVPGFVLKLTLGEMSRLLLTGQRALPAKAQDQGFNFGYQRLETALAAATKAN
ncbi:TIGR01777 family oxidoreductase [Halopseudomonas sp.]|uniref:TIGR01777 family oxidoreductase n=1 Tax=Halopseudomonas sp. TaxID=2901191 RepID=UPI00300278DF